LTVTDVFNGCTGTATVLVRDQGAPPFVDAGPDQLIDCATSVVTLQGFVTSGDASQGRTIAWTPAAGVSDPTILTPTTTVAGTYTLTVTDIASGCTSSDTVTVTTDMRAPLVDAGPGSTLTCAQPTAPLAGSA